jgi:hypothetical protein
LFFSRETIKLWFFETKMLRRIIVLGLKDNKAPANRENYMIGGLTCVPTPK